MRIRVQNLTDGVRPTWRHGRAWLGQWRAEWVVFHKPRFDLAVRAGGYEDNELQLNIAFLLFDLYISRSFRRSFADRELSVSWHDGCLWLKLWCDDDWHRDRPWHRNTIALHVVDWILGDWKYETVKGEPFDCLVPMPEGSYRAKATPETSTWKRRFGITKTRKSVSLYIEGGIPFQGKGENSWDCGDDGLWGIGGETVERAIGNAVASVLEYRRRHGQTRETKGRVVYARTETA